MSSFHFVSLARLRNPRRLTARLCFSRTATLSLRRGGGRGAMRYLVGRAAGMGVS